MGIEYDVLRRIAFEFDRAGIFIGSAYGRRSGSGVETIIVLQASKFVLASIWSVSLSLVLICHWEYNLARGSAPVNSRRAHSPFSAGSAVSSTAGWRVQFPVLTPRQIAERCEIAVALDRVAGLTRQNNRLGRADNGCWSIPNGGR